MDFKSMSLAELVELNHNLGMELLLRSRREVIIAPAPMIPQRSSPSPPTPESVTAPPTTVIASNIVYSLPALRTFTPSSKIKKTPGVLPESTTTIVVYHVCEPVPRHLVNSTYSGVPIYAAKHDELKAFFKEHNVRFSSIYVDATEGTACIYFADRESSSAAYTALKTQYETVEFSDKKVY